MSSPTPPSQGPAAAAPPLLPLEINHAGAVGGSGSGGGEMRGFLRSSPPAAAAAPARLPAPALAARSSGQFHICLSQQRQVLLLANYKECGSPSALGARGARGRIPPALNWGRWARTLAEGGLLDGGV